MTEAALAGRRRPGPARSLTREQVIDAGLAIMAADGLHNVSFRTIGIRLGVAHKALYTYVANKDDLLAGMFDATMAGIDVPQSKDSRSPVDQLVGMFVSIRRHHIANADLIHLARPSLIGSDLATVDRILATFTALVPDVARATELYVSLVQLTVGSAMDAVRSLAPEPLESVLAEIDLTAHPQYEAFSRAWVQLDRDAAFEKLLRAIVHLAITQD